MKGKYKYNLKVTKFSLFFHIFNISNSFELR